MRGDRAPGSLEAMSRSLVVSVALLVVALAGATPNVIRAERPPGPSAAEVFNRAGIRLDASVTAGRSSRLGLAITTIRGTLRTASFRASGDLVVRLPGGGSGAVVGALRFSTRTAATGYRLRAPARPSSGRRGARAVLLRRGSLRVVLRARGRGPRERAIVTVSGLPAGVVSVRVGLRDGLARLATPGCPVRVRYSVLVKRSGAAPADDRTGQGC
jgi:hypothetical protein